MAENIKTTVEEFDEANQPIVIEHDAEEESLGGYNFEMVGSVPKELECIICHYIIKEAVELPCCHVFCKNCLIKWEEQKMNEASDQNDREIKLECCQCKALYGQGQARESKFVDRMIENSLIAKCKQHNSGCKWTGCISEYFEMHTKYCSFIEITCLFDGCNERFQRKRQDAHAEECGYRTLFCEHCGKKQRFIDLENHYAICPSFPMECPNEECDVKYERNKLNFHLREECMFESMPCPYTHVGCENSFQRKDLEGHEKEYNSKHSLMMLKQIAKVSSDLKETKAALEKTTVELHDTKTILCETNKVLDETRANLEKVHYTIARNNRNFSNSSKEIKADLAAITNKLANMSGGLNEKIDQYQQQVQTAINRCKDEIQYESDRQRVIFGDKLTRTVGNLEKLDRKIENSKSVQNKNLESCFDALTKIAYEDSSHDDIPSKLDKLVDQNELILNIKDEQFNFICDYEIFIMRMMRNMEADKFYTRHNGKSSYFKIRFPFGYINRFSVNTFSMAIYNVRKGGFSGCKSQFQSWQNYFINRLRGDGLNIFRVDIINNHNKIYWMLPMKDGVPLKRLNPTEFYTSNSLEILDNFFSMNNELLLLIE